MSFDGLGLVPEILSNLQRLKYNEATPIQLAAIPLILAGDDLLGCAQTGTGKTAAFSLPVLQKLFLLSIGKEGRETGPAESESRQTKRGSRRPVARGAISALVLTPTRELANQVAKSFATYGRTLGLRQTVIYGGVSQNPQITNLRAGVDIVVATPGRLLDLLGQGAVDLSHVKVLILDEADQMLDMGFIQPLKRIVSRIPRARQTLMFSATMPPEIQRLAEQWLNNPRTIQANVVARPPDKIKQSVTFVEQKRKPEALIEYLQATAGIRQIVFCRTKHGADRLTKLLERAEIPAVAIHGNKSQNARERALASFASECPPVLVATDVAARGLHMPGISHVINYELPHTPETYVHRIGRTARAGAGGESISFCSPDERQYLRDIERLIGRSIAVQTLAGTSAAEPARSDRRPSEQKKPISTTAPPAKSRSKSTARPKDAGLKTTQRKAKAAQKFRAVKTRTTANQAEQPTNSRSSDPQGARSRPANPRSANRGTNGPGPSRAIDPNREGQRPRRAAAVNSQSSSNTARPLQPQDQPRNRAARRPATRPSTPQQNVRQRVR